MPLGYLLKIQLKKVFMGKEKKTINVLKTFPIKVMSKLSLIEFLTSALRAVVSIFLFNNSSHPQTHLLWISSLINITYFRYLFVWSKHIKYYFIIYINFHMKYCEEIKSWQRKLNWASLICLSISAPPLHVFLKQHYYGVGGGMNGVTMLSILREIIGNI